MSENLPALIDRARDRLASARTSAEVLESRSIAQAAMHYARVTGAANETHADCLRMIVRAEMRMADEVDRGQAAGEIATKGGGNHSKSRKSATLNEMGIDKHEVHRWRTVRDAGMPVVEQVITEALSENRAPTKAAVQVAARRALGRDPLDVPVEPATTPDDSNESTTLYHLKRYWGMAGKKDRQAFRRWIDESH